MIWTRHRRRGRAALPEHLPDALAQDIALPGAASPRHMAYDIQTDLGVGAVPVAPDRNTAPPPAPSQVLALTTADVVELTQLAGAFDDATVRQDPTAFAALWAPDGVWEIARPLPMTVVGREEIVARWTSMLGDLGWFFRASFTGHLQADPGRPAQAVGRWPSVELGPRPDGTGYFNYAVYDDTYRKLDDRWVFAERRYRYLYLDSHPLAGHGGASLTADAVVDDGIPATPSP